MSDVYATTAQLFDALNKLGTSDTEIERAELCLGAATAEIDGAIGWYDDEPDPESWNDLQYALANRVCLGRAVEWWKANDAAFGMIGTADVGMLRTPREGFERHRNALMPLIVRFGVA